VEPSELVAALEALAARLGVPVRYDTFDRGLAKGRTCGGLCRLRGQPIIVLDAGLGARDHAATLARALATFELDGISLPTAVRATIRAHGRTLIVAPMPLARSKLRPPPEKG
jgi:hypothetical protein